jgi:glucosamine--fructose-6-phosphate aminotransferase (isomerizing)
MLVACGTSWHAALVGKYLLEQVAQVPAEVDYGSEFRYRTPLVGPASLCVAITQSGETADTLAAFREAKRLGALPIAICNVQGSMITREAAGTLLTHAGPEIGVASTKAFTAQIVALALLALRLGRLRGTLTVERSRRSWRAWPGAASHGERAGESGRWTRRLVLARRTCCISAASTTRSRSSARDEGDLPHPRAIRRR